MIDRQKTKHYLSLSLSLSLSLRKTKLAWIIVSMFIFSLIRKKTLKRYALNHKMLPAVLLERQTSDCDIKFHIIHYRFSRSFVFTGFFSGGKPVQRFC